MPTPDQHLDTAALSELKQIMGDEFSTLVTTFVNDSVIRIQAIKEAVASADTEEIRRAAHSFKGSASNMGATRLTELCRGLEERGHNGVTDGCDELMEQVIAEYNQVEAALNNLDS